MWLRTLHFSNRPSRMDWVKGTKGGINEGSSLTRGMLKVLVACATSKIVNIHGALRKKEANLWLKESADTSK